MKRNGILVRKKYREYLFSTMSFSLSIYLAAIVDGILVSRLIGAQAFAAVNLTMPIVFIKNIFFCLFISGGVTLAAQYMGARRFKECNRVFTLSLAGGTVFSGLLGLLGFFTIPLQTYLLAGTGTLAEGVRTYLIPLWLLGPFIILANGSAAFMRLESRHKLAAMIPIAANLINLACDYLYIRVFGLGLLGAGFATMTGYGLALFLLLPYYRSKERLLHFVRPGKGDAALLLGMFRVGLPISLIDGCDMLANYTINTTMLIMLGDAGGQVISVCNAAMLYANMICDGMATSMGSVVGALYGERDKRGMLQVLKNALLLSLGACLLLFAFFQLFPEFFAGFYGIREPEILALLIPWLRLHTLAIPLAAPLYILRSFYQSTGRENAATALSVLEGAVFLLPVFYLLSRTGVFAMAASHAVSALMAIVLVVLVMQRKAKKEGCENFLMLRSAKEGLCWEASIGCREEETEAAIREIIAFGRKNGLSDEYANVFGVSAEELCLNIVRYAGLGPEDQIDLFLCILPEESFLKVRDGGRIFNPTEHMENEEWVTGLKLVRSLASKIEYQTLIGFNTTIVTVKTG